MIKKTKRVLKSKTQNGVDVSKNNAARSASMKRILQASANKHKVNKY